MKTMIIGSEGSMGKRYQAILKYFGESYWIYDTKHKYETSGEDDWMFWKEPPADRFIVATPTDTHAQVIKWLDKWERPILCEKPLSKDKKEIEAILNCKSPLSIMMQYRFFDQSAGDGPSWYNFFRHGNDGLYWDCFQIIALAKSSVRIDENSPIWSCGLNGQRVDLNQMDAAYVWAVREFLNEQYLDREQMRKWHEKVSNYEEKCNTRPFQL